MLDKKSLYKCISCNRQFLKSAGYRYGCPVCGGQLLELRKGIITKKHYETYNSFRK